MKDEEDDNIIPNDDENNQDENQFDENQDDSDEIINVDAKNFEGQHFYENQEEEGEDVITKVTGMYKDWFLDYASYVILERAVPAIEDGFKPVQRRIMHSLKELDDGRYNKVANVVGHTMQYHPHGDASIGDAMVQIGQKDLLIDCQGNWGNILTGDGAAASRYIEARLSKFALEVLYSPKITDWGVSYDGRRAEPNNLPVKFPLLLAQGAEGIAVGLSTKVLPHNFNELIDASIKILKGKPFPEKELHEKLTLKSFYDMLAVRIGGPVQTILTGTIGFILLLFRRKKILENGMKILDWLYVFLSLFWLREVCNLTMSVASALLNGKKNYFGGDEKNIALMLEIPKGSIAIPLAIIGLCIALFVIFKIIPKEKRLIFISSGFLGGIAGFILWLRILGPIVMP